MCQGKSLVRVSLSVCTASQSYVRLQQASTKAGLGDDLCVPVQYDQYRDIESQEELLVPGMSKTDNMLRWGFIRKVHLKLVILPP